MGIYYTLHCEVMKDGKWINWDLYRFKGKDNYEIIPIIEGKSFLGSALNWYDLLSHRIPREEVGSATSAAHPTACPQDQHWCAFDYLEFFKEKDFSVPEYAGYFAKDVMAQFKAEKDYDILEAAVCSDAFLSPADYARLTPQAQHGFEYFEFTAPFGIHDTMRRIQQGTEIRLYASDDLMDGPVRIVILVS